MKIGHFISLSSFSRTNAQIYHLHFTEPLEVTRWCSGLGHFHAIVWATFDLFFLLRITDLLRAVWRKCGNKCRKTMRTYTWKLTTSTTSPEYMWCLQRMFQTLVITQTKIGPLFPCCKSVAWSVSISPLPTVDSETNCSIWNSNLVSIQVPHIGFCIFFCHPLSVHCYWFYYWPLAI